MKEQAKIAFLKSQNPDLRTETEGLKLANEIVKKNKAAPSAVLLDPQSRIAHAYGATVTPHMYVIDTGGQLRRGV